MVKVLLFGDLQINHRRPDYMTFLTGALEELERVIRDVCPVLVINLGDMFDTKHLVSVDDLVYGWEWSRRLGRALERSNRRLWVLKGNHDISDKHGDRASVQVLENPMTKVCMSMGVHVIYGLRVLVIPYTEDINSVYEEAQGIERPDLIVGHCDWIGCRLTPSYVSKAGLDPAWFERNYPGVPIFNGHYHHPMDLGDLHMVGSPLHKDFNDIAGEIPRGFTLWDSETGKIERIANPSTYYCTQLTFTKEQEISEWRAKLAEHKHALRVKVFVPQALLDEAKDAFGDFLWNTVQPVDSEAIRAIHTSGVSVQSTASEIVKKGVDESDEQVYDRELLAEFGRKAFSV
jgi:hypothetical protein